ncbi:RILP-like protein 2 [Rhineura floridana]|uniref:RILP-like protein 2 n=1 Tax=Rhineura floridana TaxID=261503 RepID=UPI002AC804E6|nr:RILP-like protein 2 [Rhineura floridana]
MQAQEPQKEEEEEEEQEGGDGPDSPFKKSPFQLTAEDVYDISYILGRELHRLNSGPHMAVAPRVAHLQFKIVSILEMLETLVNENNLAVEALKMERDSLKREAEGLRKQVASGSMEQVNLGPNKMIIDLTDANRPRFTLQELREVLQERNQLKAQLLVAQEELQCYKSGLVPEKQDWTEPLQKGPSVETTSRSCQGREEKATIKRLFAFRKPR